MTRKRGNFAQLSPPFAANSIGFVPTDPFFREDLFGTESPHVRMPDELKEDFAYSTAGKMLETPPEPESRTILRGEIRSPLNDLRASPEARDDERYRVIKELEKLNVGDDGDAYNRDTRMRDFTHDEDDDMSYDREDRTVAYHLNKHSQSSPDIEQIVRRRDIEEDGELCEHCRLEDERRNAARSEAMLKDKLDEHIHKINEQRSKSLRRKPELLPMGVLPPFMNRDDNEDRIRMNKQKAAYRVELEEEMTRKRLADELEKAREKQMHNYANTEDAREYARIRDKQIRHEEAEKVRNRDILEKQMEIRKLTRQDSENRLEWWEKKEMPGQKPVERDAAFLSDQLRRNEALKSNVYHLERFKDHDKDERIAKRAADKHHFDELRVKIGEQSALIRDRDMGEKQRQFVYSTNPSVYKAWEDAHALNDKKYRVLQDLELQSRRHQLIDEQSKCIRCRRCHRLIKRELRRRVVEEGRRI